MAEPPRGPVFAFPGVVPFPMPPEQRLPPPGSRAWRTLLRCDAVVRREAGWSPLAQLAAPPPPGVGVPPERCYLLNFALQVAALAELREAGLEPRAVAALSGGEPAAAHAAGVLSLADATRVVLHAGRTLQAHATGLRLAIVWLGRAEALRSAALHGGGVAVAGDMLPDVVMVCGEAAPLASFLEALDARGVRQVPIPLPFGAHSPALRAGRRGFLAAVAGIVLREPRLPVLSATAGRWMRLAGEFGPAHWWRHLAAPVRFRAVVDRLLAGGFGPLVEVGPSSAFSSLVPRSGGACLRTEEALATFAPRSPGAPSA